MMRSVPKGMCLRYLPRIMAMMSVPPEVARVLKIKPRPTPIITPPQRAMMKLAAGSGTMGWPGRLIKGSYP